MAKAEQDKSSKTLDIKLNRILTGNYQSTDFIIADAKDADMAFGVRAAGPRTGRNFEDNGPEIFKTRSEYLQDMRELIAQGVLDIILTSASNGERLFKDKALGKKITLAVRGNDASDIWNPRGGNYPASPSRPFATANLKMSCSLILVRTLALDDSLTRGCVGTWCRGMISPCLRVRRQGTSGRHGGSFVLTMTDGSFLSYSFPSVPISVKTLPLFDSGQGMCGHLVKALGLPSSAWEKAMGGQIGRAHV